MRNRENENSIQRRLLPLIALVSLIFILSCNNRVYDVTGDYRTSTNHYWCLTEDAFIVKDPEDQVPWIRLLGSSAGLPSSLEEYIANPNGWHTQNKYKELFSNIYVRVPKIVAAHRKGSRFKIVQVSYTVGIDAGAWIHPMIVFLDEPVSLGPIDGMTLFRQDDKYRSQKILVGRAAATCDS